MGTHEGNRGTLSRNLSVLIGMLALPMIGYSFFAGFQILSQFCLLAVMGGCLGLYVHSRVRRGIDCIRKGYLRSLLLWTCASAIASGFVFLLCRSLASGTEEGIFAWIVSGSPWVVFTRGACVGAVGGLVQSVEQAKLPSDHARSETEPAHS